MNGSVPAWPTASVPDSVPSVAPAVSPPLSPWAGFEPGSEWDGSLVVVVVVVLVVVVLVAVAAVVVTAGGTGAGPGCGCGPGSPQLPERWLLSACTSTSWPPEHGAALWGWLLPGPCRTVVAFPPFFSAICPAVCPFPYRFVLSD